jgi:hypothetical protein
VYYGSKFKLYSLLISYPTEHRQLTAGWVAWLAHNNNASQRILDSLKLVDMGDAIEYTIMNAFCMIVEIN